jgi:hypothetical protein
MKLWKKLLLGLLALVVLLVVVGFFLPSRTRVERSVNIRATPEALFPRVATLTRWPEWTAWTTNRFPDMRTSFSGAASGVGAMMKAEGKSSGDGTVTITRAEPAKGIWYDLDFEHGTQLFHGSITFDTATDGMKVTWVIETDMGANPFKRWAGLVLDKLMGGDMAAGLANLKQRVESVK